MKQATVQNGVYGVESVFSSLRIGKSAIDELGRLWAIYGSNFRFRAGPREGFMFSSPDLVHRFLFEERDKVIRSPGYRMLADVMGNGLLTADGATWKKHRQAAQPTFASVYNGSYLPIMSESARKALPLSEDKTYTDINIQGLVDSYAMQVSLKLFFGDHMENVPDDFGDRVSEANVLIGKRVRSFYIPKWFPNKTAVDYAEVRDYIKDIISNLVSASITEPGNLLSEIVERSDLTTDESLAMAGNLFISSFETSSSAFGWAITSLVEHPEIQDELRAEIDGVLKNIDLSEDTFVSKAQIERMPTLRLFILESMRLNPSVWMYARQAASDINSEGFRIKKNSLILLSPYYLHRCKTVWGEDAGEFKLRRFEGLNIRELAKECKYLPFSVGERNCIGQGLAMYELSIGIIYLLRHFKVSKGESYNIKTANSFTLKATSGIHVDLTSIR